MAKCHRAEIYTSESLYKFLPLGISDGKQIGISDGKQSATGMILALIPVQRLIAQYQRPSSPLTFSIHLFFRSAVAASSFDTNGPKLILANSE